LQFEASLSKQFARPYLKKILHKKRVGGMAQGVGPDFKLQYHKHTHTQRQQVDSEG
jgi:hypothetical protein